MDATSETFTVERQIEIAASPETVWELLTDPEEVVRWFGMEASFDLRPGGVYRVVIFPDNVALGEFIEIDPPHRLVFTWGNEPGTKGSLPAGSSTVAFELAPLGDGTLLRLTHSDLPTRESADAHDQGWGHYLGRLAVVATGGDPGVDPWREQ